MMSIIFSVEANPGRPRFLLEALAISYYRIQSSIPGVNSR
jgi:hypothetical protein